MNFTNFNKTIPYIKKKGIPGFFQIIYHNSFDLVLLNLIFILTSLPIFTIGASSHAFCAVTMKMVKDEPTYVIRDYFENFKKYFKMGIVSFLIGLPTCCVLAFSTYFYFAYAAQMPYLYLPAFIGIVVIMIFSVMFCYYFSMSVSVELKLMNLIKNAFILTLASKNSLVILLFNAVILFALVALFPYSIAAIPFIPFALMNLAATYFTYQPIKENVIIDEN